MNYDLTHPCGKCPFRKDIEPYLKKARVRQIRQMLVDQQGVFPCHQSVDYKKHQDDEGNHHYTPGDPNEQHCAGAMILLEKIGRPNQMMRICERLGMYDHKKLKMDAPVFDTFEEMAKAQKS